MNAHLQADKYISAFSLNFNADNESEWMTGCWLFN